MGTLGGSVFVFSSFGLAWSQRFSVFSLDDCESQRVWNGREREWERDPEKTKMPLCFQPNVPLNHQFMIRKSWNIRGWFWQFNTFSLSDIWVPVSSFLWSLTLFVATNPFQLWLSLVFYFGSLFLHCIPLVIVSSFVESSCIYQEHLLINWLITPLFKVSS